MKRRSNAEILAVFKIAIKKAAKMFNKPESEITCGQFLAAANGRIGRDSINRLGVSFASLRGYLYPPNKVQGDNKSNDMIKRILGIK